MKESYFDAEIEIVHFAEADILTSSGEGGFVLDDNEVPVIGIPGF